MNADAWQAPLAQMQGLPMGATSLRAFLRTVRMLNGLSVGDSIFDTIEKRGELFALSDMGWAV